MADAIKPAYPTPADNDRTFKPRDPSPFAGHGDNQGGRMPPFPTAGEQVMPQVDGDRPAG